MKMNRKECQYLILQRKIFFPNDFLCKISGIMV